MGLSVAVILAGSCQVGWTALHLDVLLLALLSAAAMQLTSNFANDYGDFKKGTDQHRPERSLTSGTLTEKQIARAIKACAILSFVFVVALLLRSPVSLLSKSIMLGIGALSIVAAITYTLGKRPYGYYAFGDVAVFIFFGLVGVLGSYFLQGGDLSKLNSWAIAVAFGTLSTSVLNINNIRDRESDHANGKTTIANLLGERAMNYQYALFAVAILSFVVYTINNLWGLLPLIASIAASTLLSRQLNTATQHKDYNLCLANTAKFTLGIALLTAFAGLIQVTNG